jgi:hypothetical protein
LAIRLVSFDQKTLPDFQLCFIYLAHLFGEGIEFPQINPYLTYRRIDAFGIGVLSIRIPAPVFAVLNH